jgi:hypothetical protein
MTELKRPLAFIALGLLLAALLLPFFIAALGRADLAVGFSLVAGLLALIMAAFSRSDRTGLSVIFALFLFFAFAFVFILIQAGHPRGEAKAAMPPAMPGPRDQTAADDPTLVPPGTTGDFTPRYEATGRWLANGDSANPALISCQGRHVVCLYNNGGYTHIFSGDYVDDITIKGMQTRCKLADHTVTREAITLTFLSPDRIRVEWVALDSNSDLAKGQSAVDFLTRSPAGLENAGPGQVSAVPFPAVTHMQPPMQTASPSAYRPGNNGYLNFKFGMSLGEVVAALGDPSPNGSENRPQDEGRVIDSAAEPGRSSHDEWGLPPGISKAGYLRQNLVSTPDACDSLPIAGEYKNAVVHYYAVPMKSVAGLLNLGEYSDSSAIFFMFQDDKLFRISLRFLNDPTCPNHEAIYNAFAGNNGGAVRFLYGNRKTFRVDGANDYLIGQLSLDGVFMTFIQNNSPLSLSENYNW